MVVGLIWLVVGCGLFVLCCEFVFACLESVVGSSFYVGCCLWCAVCYLQFVVGCW